MSQTHKSNAALAGIKVLDLSRVLAGPWAGQTLADLGADVIKVEQPQKGDDTRHWGPPYMDNEDGDPSSESAYFMCANRGKKSVCIDISSEQGQKIIHQLVVDSDVVIENFKTGQLAKYHLDYASLSEINPRIIYCSITGFGQTGPYAERPGYDFLIQAMSGLMSVTGDDEEHPMKVGVALTDILTGLYAVIGILAALNERQTSGRGQHIDLSLFDVAVASMANQASNFLVGGVVPKPMGNSHPNIVPYQPFMANDGMFVLAVGNDGQFERCCDALGMPEVASDQRFQTNPQRVANRDALIRLFSDQIKKRSRPHWLQQFESANVPVAPINSLDEVFKDPQVLHRQMAIKVPHSQNADLNLVANPLNFSRSPLNYQFPPPLLGEHTEEILESLVANIKGSSLSD